MIAPACSAIELFYFDTKLTLPSLHLLLSPSLPPYLSPFPLFVLSSLLTPPSISPPFALHLSALSFTPFFHPLPTPCLYFSCPFLFHPPLSLPLCVSGLSRVPSSDGDWPERDLFWCPWRFVFQPDWPLQDEERCHRTALDRTFSSNESEFTLCNQSLFWSLSLFSPFCKVPQNKLCCIILS